MHTFIFYLRFPFPFVFDNTKVYISTLYVTHAASSIELTEIHEPEPAQRSSQIPIASPDPVEEQETPATEHEATDSQQHEKTIYPKGLSLAILFGSACLSGVLTELDEQVLATAIPAITNTYGTIADVGW